MRALGKANSSTHLKWQRIWKALLESSCHKTKYFPSGLLWSVSLVSAFEDILFACIQLPDASAPKACCYLVNLPKSTFALAVQLNPKLLHSPPYAKEVFSRKYFISSIYMWCTTNHVDWPTRTQVFSSLSWWGVLLADLPAVFS